MHLKITSRLVFSVFLFSLGFSAMNGTARAADTPNLTPGNFELGLYGGASYGLDKLHGMGGVNLSYSLPKLLLPYVEFSYFPGIARQEDGNGFSFHGSDRLIDFHGGVHIRLIKAESQVVPYAVIGFGLLRSRITGFDHFNTPQLCPAVGKTVNDCPITPETSTDPAVNFGGGLRVYHKSWFGYRVEGKAYRPISGRFSNVVGKFEAGIFFKFGGK